MNTNSIFYTAFTVAMRAALVGALAFGGWLIYSELPESPKPQTPVTRGETVLQIVLVPSVARGGEPLDIPVELYPIDVVAARHEYFTERRAGKRFDDFLNERMQGRTPVATKLDQTGQGFISVRPGNWWLHALLAGEDELEWRLPISVTGRKQTIELTSQNVYTRTRTF